MEVTTKEMSKNEILKGIVRRRAIYPDRFTDQVVTVDEVRQLLGAARYAPTHRLTEPWRFHVIMNQAKNNIAAQVREYIETHSGKPEKGARMQEKFDQSQAVIVVAFQRDDRERVPEWEEIAATAMAVQNLWIYTDSLGMGGYWSTGAVAVEALSRIVDLQDGEKVLGMFFLGRHEYEPRPRPSKSVDEYTTWLI